jgi:UrcA family protein
MNRFTTTMMISTLAFGYQLANAAPPQDAPSVIVQFADLDLTHGEGVAVLFRRLQGAAESVCAPQNGSDLGRQMRYKTCVQSALGAAVVKVDRPELTAYYRAKIGGGNAPVQIAQK